MEAIRGDTEHRQPERDEGRWKDTRGLITRVAYLLSVPLTRYPSQRSLFEGCAIRQSGRMKEGMLLVFFPLCPCQESRRGLFRLHIILFSLSHVLHHLISFSEGDIFFDMLRDLRRHQLGAIARPVSTLTLRRITERMYGSTFWGNLNVPSTPSP